MNNWLELSSDVNWVDYGGMWARRGFDGAWYVLIWTNLLNDGGSEFAETPYGCEVKRIDLKEIPGDVMRSALDSCGYNLSNGELISDSGDSIETERIELAQVEMCIQYGLGAPLETFTGKSYPLRIRAAARKFAERMIEKPEELEERLNRRVNAIGSTAREYGVGDINSALIRAGDDPTPIGKLMRKLHRM